MENNKPESNKPTKEDVNNYNSELKLLTSQASKYILHPIIYQEKAFALIDKGVLLNIISLEYAERKKAEFMHKINTPSRLKESLKQKLIKAKEKYFKEKKKAENSSQN
jgi:hypothetical protein